MDRKSGLTETFNSRGQSHAPLTSSSESAFGFALKPDMLSEEEVIFKNEPLPYLLTNWIGMTHL